MEVQFREWTGDGVTMTLHVTSSFCSAAVGCDGPIYCFTVRDSLFLGGHGPDIGHRWDDDRVQPVAQSANCGCFGDARRLDVGRPRSVECA